MNEWLVGRSHNESQNDAFFWAERPRREKLSHRSPYTIVGALPDYSSSSLFLNEEEAIPPPPPTNKILRVYYMDDFFYFFGECCLKKMSLVQMYNIFRL